MSRIRSIHPGFFTDEDLVGVSMAARLLFLGLGVEADDKGAFEWKPLTLKMRLFPVDNVDIAELLAELVAVNAIRPYEIDGRKYGAIRNFRRHQKPKTPNDIHPMADDFRNYVGLGGAKAEKAAVNEEQFPPKGEKPPQMEDGGEEEDGDLGEANASLVGEPRFAVVDDVGFKLDQQEDYLLDDLVDPDTEPPLTKAEIMDSWNRLAAECGLPKVEKLTPDRAKNLGARMKTYPEIKYWQQAFATIRNSPFLRGEGRNGWRADFDFLIQAKSFNRLVEGSYSHGA